MDIDAVEVVSGHDVGGGHHARSGGGKEEGEEVDEGGNGTAESGAAGKEGQEPGEGDKGNGDEVEGKGDLGEVVVGVSVGEDVAGDAVGGAKVVLGLKGETSAGGGAVSETVGRRDAAVVEEGPSDGVGQGAVDSVRVKLEKVDLVQWGGVAYTSEQEEEEEHNGTYKLETRTILWE